MLAPPEVADYVVVHELCHRKQMNHSPAFWNLVEQVLPDYRRQKTWLRQHGGALLSRLSSLEKQE
jgi:predicted metal-dependent hydrolase